MADNKIQPLLERERLIGVTKETIRRQKEKKVAPLVSVDGLYRRGYAAWRNPDEK